MEPLRERRRITIRDVASEAGVSVTTVSHALNGKGSVDPETRRRVAGIATELGYRASRTARALRAGRTASIALILPGITATEERGSHILGLEYYMRVAAGAADAAFAREHSLLLVSPQTVLADLRDLGVDGGIVCDPKKNDPRLGLFLELHLPVVSIERDAGRPDHHSYVHGDNPANTRRLLDHIATGGAQRIALLASDPTSAWSIETSDAYRAWCAEHGREPVVEQTVVNDVEMTAHHCAGLLLDRAPRPDAIIALAERHAGGVLRAVRERGLRTPEDVMVASGVDASHARETEPPLTAIDLDPVAHGVAAVDLLVDQLSGLPADAPRLVNAELRVRASTGG